MAPAKGRAMHFERGMNLSVQEESIQPRSLLLILVISSR